MLFRICQSVCLYGVLPAMNISFAQKQYFGFLKNQFSDDAFYPPKLNLLNNFYSKSESFLTFGVLVAEQLYKH